MNHLAHDARVVGNAQLVAFDAQRGPADQLLAARSHRKMLARSAPSNSVAASAMAFSSASMLLVCRQACVISRMVSRRWMRVSPCWRSSIGVDRRAKSSRQTVQARGVSPTRRATSANPSPSGTAVQSFIVAGASRSTASATTSVGTSLPRTPLAAATCHCGGLARNTARASALNRVRASGSTSRQEGLKAIVLARRLQAAA